MASDVSRVVAQRLIVGRRATSDRGSSRLKETYLSRDKFAEVKPPSSYRAKKSDDKERAICYMGDILNRGHG